MIVFSVLTAFQVRQKYLCNTISFYGGYSVAQKEFPFIWLNTRTQSKTKHNIYIEFTQSEVGYVF